ETNLIWTRGVWFSNLETIAQRKVGIEHDVVVRPLEPRRARTVVEEALSNEFGRLPYGDVGTSGRRRVDADRLRENLVVVHAADVSQPLHRGRIRIAGDGDREQRTLRLLPQRKRLRPVRPSRTVGLVNDIDGLQHHRNRRHGDVDPLRTRDAGWNRDGA